MKDKVSIIVPIYNMENYLEKCIESIIKQSYKNIEIILINDGSTDKSEFICKKYQMKDYRVKFISSRNKGVSNARNLGIKASTGVYISFIDPDDTVDKKYIEEMLIYMKKYSCDVVFCLARYIYPMLDKIYDVKFENKEKLSNYFDKDFYLIAEYFHTPWGKLYKNDIIKKYNIKFPINLITAEDQIFNQEYLKYVRTYKFLNKNLYNYYIRKNNSLSKSLSDRHFSSDVENLKMKKNFLINELPLVSKKEKNICLLKYTKFMIFKYLILENINKNELKKMRSRLVNIKEIVPLDDIFILNMNLKEYISIYFLKTNKWFGLYTIAFIRYLKTLWRN